MSTHSRFGIWDARLDFLLPALTVRSGEGGSTPLGVVPNEGNPRLILRLDPLIRSDPQAKAMYHTLHSTPNNNGKKNGANLSRARAKSRRGQRIFDLSPLQIYADGERVSRDFQHCLKY